MGLITPPNTVMVRYEVERHDQEDGSITYEVWAKGNHDDYRRLCSINEENDSLLWSDEDIRPKHSAKSDAELIVKALNTYTP